MNDLPTSRARWFQLRLSTIFVLIAIAAGGMATWPWLKPLPRGYMNCGGYVWMDVINPLAIFPAVLLVSFAGWKSFARAKALMRDHPGLSQSLLFWLVMAIGMLAVTLF